MSQDVPSQSSMPGDIFHQQRQRGGFDFIRQLQRRAVCISPRHGIVGLQGVRYAGDLAGFHKGYDHPQ